MKVLYIIESLGRGGAEQALVNVLPAIRAHGHHCEVAALWPPYDLAADLEEQGFPVHRLDITGRWNAAQAVLRLVRVARRVDPDLLHAQLSFAILYNALTKPLWRRPLRIATFQFVTYQEFPANTVARKIRKRVERFVVHRWTDRTTGVSEAVRDHFRLHFGIPSVSVIHNALDLDAISERSDGNLVRAKYGVLPSEFLVTTSARLAEQKGHRFLIEALSLLRFRGLLPKALFIGEGRLRKNLSEQARVLGLAQQVVMPGELPNSEVLQLVAASEAFVLPSLGEGLPVALAEAMAIGKMVIATRVAGSSELVEDGVSGLLVPPSDPEALAAAIERSMYDNGLRERLGTAARLKIRLSLSKEAIASEWSRYYKSIERECRDNVRRAC